MGIVNIGAGSTLEPMTAGYAMASAVDVANDAALEVADISGSGFILDIAWYQQANAENVDIGINTDAAGEELIDFSNLPTLLSTVYNVSAYLARVSPIISFTTSCVVNIYNREGTDQDIQGALIYGYYSHEVSREIILAGNPIPFRSYTKPYDVMVVTWFGKRGLGSILKYPIQSQPVLKFGKMMDFAFNTTLNERFYSISQSNYTGEYDFLLEDEIISLNIVNGVIQSIPKFIRTIDFWERFTSTEQETLMGSNNTKVQAFMMQLRLRDKINIRWPKIVVAVNALETAGLIGAGRAAEILV